MDGDWPAHDSSHSPQNNEPDVAGFGTDPVIFAHRVASQFQLGDKSRADVVDIAKVCSVFLYLHMLKSLHAVYK